MSTGFIPDYTPIKKTTNLAIVQENSFLPLLSLTAFREQMRVDDDVSDARALRQLQSAAYAINNDIKTLVAKLEKPLTGRELHLYEDAVYNRAKASIIENYRDISSERTGDAHARAMELRVYDYEQKSVEARRLLLNAQRMTVQLV